MTYEYLVTAWTHKLNNGPADFSECCKRLEFIAKDGWKLVTITKGIAYFERPLTNEQGGGYGYHYETVQDGYVIYGKDGKIIPPYELVKMLGV